MSHSSLVGMRGESIAAPVAGAAAGGFPLELPIIASQDARLDAGAKPAEPVRMSPRDPRQAILDVSTGGSYPSGHAMFGCMTAVLLGVMVPEQRTALLERGSAYAQNRVVGGVHYPTDVEAGCTGGKIVAAVLLQSPVFQDDFATARDETRRALGLPAAPSKPN
jgi:acid phosphatase (class A)